MFPLMDGYPEPIFGALELVTTQKREDDCRDGSDAQALEGPCYFQVGSLKAPALVPRAHHELPRTVVNRPRTG